MGRFFSQQRVVMPLADQLTAVHRQLQVNLRTILPGRTSNHMFDFLSLAGKQYPLCFAARTERVSDKEVLVSVLEDIHIESVEAALRKCAMKLDVARHFRDIRVRIIDYDLATAKSQVEAYVRQAKDEASTLLEQPSVPPFSQSLRLHLFLIDLAAAAKLHTLA